MIAASNENGIMKRNRIMKRYCFTLIEFLIVIAIIAIIGIV